MNKNLKLLEIGKILINIALLPLYFIKMFHDVGHLPGFNEFGEEIIIESHYYYSIYDKLTREKVQFLLWISVAIIIFSIALSLVNIIVKENKKLRAASHLAFGISALVFLILLFIAASIQYYY